MMWTHFREMRKRDGKPMAVPSLSPSVG